MSQDGPTVPTNLPQPAQDGRSQRYRCLKNDKWGRCLCEHHCCTYHTNCRELSCDCCTETGSLALTQPAEQPAEQPPMWGIRTVVTEGDNRHLTELTFGNLTVLMTPEACTQLGVALIESGYHASQLAQKATQER